MFSPQFCQNLVPTNSICHTGRQTVSMGALFTTLHLPCCWQIFCKIQRNIWELHLVIRLYQYLENIHRNKLYPIDALFTTLHLLNSDSSTVNWMVSSYWKGFFQILPPNSQHIDKQHICAIRSNFGDSSSVGSSCGERSVLLRNLTLESQCWLSRDPCQGSWMAVASPWWPNSTFPHAALARAVLGDQCWPNHLPVWV